ncbi:MAG: aminotransferase class I/II-fold pyridoxal phosphate-dependent enzyme [Saprospiraceae bacterium]|nr:aminotransferase class I/II-fold pyridoxal phosphate-dependent enzyme [Saprospiraceae bacterium]
MSFNHSAFETLCAKEIFDPSEHQWAHNLPIYASSTFVYESAEASMDFFAGKSEKYMHIYSRWSNPTVMALETKLAAIEAFDTGKEAACLFFSSGMAAISACIMALVKHGSEVLTQGNLYGTTTEFLQTTLADQGVTTHVADLSDLNEVETFLKAHPGIQLLYLESPANPTLSCIDILALTALAKQYDCKTILDNTFNTAYVQQPLELDVDYVVYSATKFLNGHGSALGGAVISYDREFIISSLWKKRKTLGHNSNPFDAWLTYNGLKTLPLRMRKHISNAQAIAEFLEDHPAVKKVNYLGLASHPDHALAKRQMHSFGSMLSFELMGGLEAGKRLMDSIQLLTLTASLGTTDTLISHPASMTHGVVPKAQREAYGITDGLVRISVGLEGVADIIADLEQGL